jgi:nucleoside-diphosphate-sugar epimerase
VPASISDIRMLLRVKVLPKAHDARRVFITGGTGYLGSNLIPVLIERGHRVRALIRTGSRGKVPRGCEVVTGNPLDASTYRQLVKPCDTFIHLVGVRHPSSAKRAELREVDLVGAREAIAVAADLGIGNFVYVSVAHPAPIMRAYVVVREECEHMIEERRLNAVVLRPWYVVGPGHHWPVILNPFYKVFEWLPFTRSSAQRLGLVTLQQMVLGLTNAVESPARGIRIIEVPEIRAAQLQVTNEPVRQTA